MSSQGTWIGVAFDPLDTLFFRDGRPFDAANRVQSGWPTPQTLAGALRTALLTRTGFRFERFHPRGVDSIERHLLEAGAEPGIVESEFRGPFLALRDDKTVEPLLPLPAVLAPAKAKGRWSSARPVTESIESVVPGWTDVDGLCPLYRLEEADPKGDRPLVTLRGVQRFLKGEGPSESDWYRPDDLFGWDRRVGIAIDPDRLTSAEGQLYAIGLLALKPRMQGRRRVCLYAEIKIGSGFARDANALLEEAAIPFGGEGRHVLAQAIATPNWPRPDEGADASMWYLAAPTFLPRRKSKRPLPANPGLRAAASAAGMAVSGWDIARGGPRATRFAVPAGAVYFLDGPGTPDGFLDGSLSDAVNLRREGWGFALQGVWNKKVQGHVG